MPRFKRVIMRLSVFLLLFLLVATVFSKTVYRLLLPQVHEASVSATGGLDNSLTFRAVVGSPIDDIDDVSHQGDPTPTETAPENPQYAVDLSLPFYVIQMILMHNGSLSATAEQIYETAGTAVSAEISGYDYDVGSDSYIVHLSVRSKGKPITAGLPLTFIITPRTYIPPYFVPLNSVYTELLAGKPQYYVYAIEDRQTMWGRETYIQKRIVTLGGSDYQTAQVTFTDEVPKRVACYPTRPLNDGDAVKVLIES